jgi:hypothetical protein
MQVDVHRGRLHVPGRISKLVASLDWGRKDGRQRRRNGGELGRYWRCLKRRFDLPRPSLAFEHLMPMQVDVHRGRLHVPGRISKLVASLDKAYPGRCFQRNSLIHLNHNTHHDTRTHNLRAFLDSRSLDKASGAAIKKRPKIVGPGVVVRVVVEMDQAVHIHLHGHQVFEGQYLGGERSDGRNGGGRTADNVLTDGRPYPDHAQW